MRAAYIIACFGVGATCSYFAYPFLTDNYEAVQIMVTVFTVLAGFLVAVITIVGDPILLPHGSWRLAEVNRPALEARLIRYTWLFSIYLITIGIIFVSVLLKDAPEEVVSTWIKEGLQAIYLALGIAAFLLSLALPGMLMSLQRKRVDAEVERRRRADGIPEQD